MDNGISQHGGFVNGDARAHYLSAEELAAALEGSRQQNGFMARCPAHDDDKASLSIREQKGKVLVHCHAGCPQGVVLDALRGRDLWPERREAGTATQSRSIVATYDYCDEQGELRFQTVRYAPKDFRQRQPDGKGGWTWNIKGVRPVPYLLPEFIEAIALDRLVLIVEGEKDCDNLAKLGIAATCNAAGAGKWKPEHAAFLKGADVVILPDNDEPGREHSEIVAASLNGIAARVRILALPDMPEKGDVSDWLNAGGEAWRLLYLIDAAPDWRPNVVPFPPRAPKKTAKKEQVSSRNDHKSDEAFPHWNVEPWSERVLGGELLDEIVAFVRRYSVLPDYAAEAVALWVLHAWAFDSFDSSPFLFITSPTKQCGKTTLLIMLTFLTPKSVAASNISPSALFRFVEQEHPTLLIDEADSFAQDNHELRNILNAGHTRASARIIRSETVGREIRPRAFSTWAPKVIAAIGVLPGTVMDRSIIIKMRRKAKSETVEKLRLRDNEDFIRLRRRAKRWADDSLRSLEGAAPKMPASLANRLEDNWLPLFAIADLAGGDWPSRTTAASRALCGAAKESDLSVELLRDIRQLFADDRCPHFGAEQLVERLIAMPETPWAELRSGKDGPRPLTSRGLAKMLAEYDIASDRTRDKRLYRKSQFEEAWDSYLPPFPLGGAD